MGLVRDVQNGIRDLGNSIAPGSGNDILLAAELVALYYAPGYIGGEAAAASSQYLGTTLAQSATIASVASAATSMAILSTMSNADQLTDPVGSAQATGLLINGSSNVAPLPVVYGARKVGGTRVYVGTSGGTNEYLHLVIALAEGQVDSFTTTYVNDTAITDTKFTGLITAASYMGTDVQTYDTALAADQPTKWGIGYDGKGVAYVYLKLKFDAKAYGGFPTITVDVKGRLVFDPRTSTTAWSANPALCIRDYLTNNRYGRGIPTSMIDDASIITAANYCDALVAIPSGTQARYTCNGVVNVDASSLDNIKGLLSSCRGVLVYSGGTYKLLVDSVGSSTFSFNEDNITGNWSIMTTGRANKFNRVTTTFYDPANNWQANYAISDSSAYRALDNGLVLEGSVDLPFTTNAYMAAQLAGLQLKQSRFGISCSFTAFQNALLCEVGDVVSISHTTPGWSGKLFRVAQITLQDNDEVEVVCSEYDATVYNLDTLTAITSTPTLSLPDPFAVASPGALTLSSGTTELLVGTDGTITSRIKVVWSSPADVFTSNAEVQFKLTIASSWQSMPLADTTAGAAWISPVADGQDYDVRLRFVNVQGVQSAWSTGTHTVVGKTAPPPPFDFFNILVQPDGTRQYNFGYSTLANQPADWMGAEIRYVSGTTSTPNWATMSLLQDATTYYTNSPVELNAPLSGTWTFACKSLDTTGNESSYLVRTLLLPDRRLGNVFDEFFEHSDGWPGTKTGCHVQAGVLEANDTTTWTTAPATWAAWGRWNLSPTSPVTYETPVRDFGTVVSGQINSTVDADGTALVELATSTNGTTWSAWGSAAAAFSVRHIKLRLTVTATGPAPVPLVRTWGYQINAPIKSEYINDVVISALTGAYRIGVGDIRIPLAGSYSFLKRTSVVIQDSSAGQWTFARQDQSLAVGPRWQFRLNGVLADPAFVDFFIEGF